MSEHIALLIDSADTVVTVFADLRKGESMQVIDRRGIQWELTALDNTPYGHKVAFKCIAEGEHVVKYGESIGIATRGILAGAHVHTHNLDSDRARGDRSGGAD